MNGEQVGLDLLPNSLQMVAELIGLDAVIQLVARYGGVRVYVPTGPTEHCVLHDCIGMESLKPLCEQYGGDYLEIPRCVNALREVRNRNIRHDAATGSSQRELALKYKLTQRQIGKILGDSPMDGLQTDLFECLEETMK